jgi:uncharacterized protein YkwD
LAHLKNGYKKHAVLRQSFAKYLLLQMNRLKSIIFVLLFFKKIILITISLMYPLISFASLLCCLAISLPVAQSQNHSTAAKITRSLTIKKVAQPTVSYPKSNPKLVATATLLPTVKQTPIITNNLLPNEKAMLQAINLLRTQPQSYLPTAEKHLAELLAKPAPLQLSTTQTRYTYDSWGKKVILGQDTTWLPASPQAVLDREEEIAATRELLIELRTAPALKPLQPIECLMEAAQTQGRDCEKTQILQHHNSDNSEIWDRIPLLCHTQKIVYGGECIAGVQGDLHTALLYWLLDVGIPLRKHRRIILDASTTYIGLYEMQKQVKTYTDSWVLTFAHE